MSSSTRMDRTAGSLAVAQPVQIAEHLGDNAGRGDPGDSGQCYGGGQTPAEQQARDEPRCRVHHEVHDAARRVSFHGRCELLGGELQSQGQQQQHHPHGRGGVEERPGAGQTDRTALGDQQPREQEQRRCRQTDAQCERPCGAEQDEEESQLDQERRVTLHGISLASRRACTLRTPDAVPIATNRSLASNN